MIIKDTRPYSGGRRLKASKLLCSLAVLVLVSSLGLTQVAAQNDADDFFGGPYADDESHSIRTIESTASHRDGIWTDIRERITHYDRTTVMDLWETTRTNSWVDVRWWATDRNNFRTTSVLADVTCRIDGLASRNECDSFDMRFNEDNYFTRTDRQQDHTVCHELAHTIGSDDGLNRDVGCFPQSGFSDARNLSGPEKDVINDRNF